MSSVMTKKAEANAKDRVSFNKGFHITDKGEVIKIAAIVTENPVVQKELTLQEEKNKNRF